MSLYQIFATFIELEKRRKPTDALMSDAAFDALKERAAEMNLPDVRIH